MPEQGWRWRRVSSSEPPEGQPGIPDGKGATKRRACIRGGQHGEKLPVRPPKTLSLLPRGSAARAEFGAGRIQSILAQAQGKQAQMGQLWVSGDSPSPWAAAQLSAGKAPPAARVEGEAGNRLGLPLPGGPLTPPNGALAMPTGSLPGDTAGTRYTRHVGEGSRMASPHALAWG